jgi:hypothetical protein
MNLLRSVPPEEAKTQAAAVSRADHPQVSAPQDVGPRQPVRRSLMSETARLLPWQPWRQNAPQWPAKGQQIETEAAPIRYVTEMIGTDADPERTIRWLTAAHGPVLRSPRHRADGRGFGPAVTRIQAFITGRAMLPKDCAFAYHEPRDAEHLSDGPTWLRV